MIGALHLIAIRIKIEKGWTAALLFSSGCAFVESAFARYVAIFTIWISRRENVMRLMEWILLILFFSLAGGCLFLAFQVPNELQEVGNLPLVLPTFFLGMFIRIIYPSMIPFWIAWNTVFVTRKIKFKILPFIIGVGLATVVIHSFYIFAGDFLIDFLKNRNRMFLMIISGFFLLTGILQLKRMKKKRIFST